MNKKLILRIVGIVSALIFNMGALFPFVSVEFFGNKMSKSLIDTSDWIFVMLNAALIIISLFLSEEIPLYICAVSSVLITIAECQAFLGGAMSQLSDVVNKGAGFYFLIIGAVLIIASAVANWFVLHKSNKSSKGSAIPDTRKCPFCAETIKSEAVLCRFCGNKVEPLTKSDTQIISEVDEPKKPVKTGKRRALSVILIVVSALVAVIVLIGIIYNGIDQPSNSHGNSQTSSSYFQPDSEEVYSSTPETTVSTTATTTTATTTTTQTTTTTPTTANEPEEEFTYYYDSIDAYFVLKGYDESDSFSPYIHILPDGTFELMYNWGSGIYIFTGPWICVSTDSYKAFKLDITGAKDVEGDVKAPWSEVPIYVYYYGDGYYAECNFDYTEDEALLGFIHSGDWFHIVYFNDYTSGNTYSGTSYNDYSTANVAYSMERASSHGDNDTVSLMDDKSFTFTTNVLYGQSWESMVYYGTWEYVTAPYGYFGMLCTITSNMYDVPYKDSGYSFTISIPKDGSNFAIFSLQCDYVDYIFGELQSGDKFYLT